MTQLTDCVDGLVPLTKLDAAEAVKGIARCTGPYLKDAADLSKARGEIREAFGDTMTERPDSTTTRAMLDELERLLPVTETFGPR